MRILVRLPNWLGDVVMSTAFVQGVAETYPDAAIDVVVKNELAPVASMIPGIAHIYPFSKQENKGLAGAYRFGKRLRDQKYDLFFNLPESLSSQVMAWASHPEKSIGFKKEGSALLSRSFSKTPGLHRVDEYLLLLERFTGNKIEQKKVSLRAQQIQRKVSQVLINFNSEAESRRMPAEKAIRIVNRLLDTFTGIKLIFIGSPKEAPFVRQILSGIGSTSPIADMAGKTSLTELAGLMAESTALISTDSGPAHLANALGTPVIALFGAGDEHNTAPYNKANLSVLRSGTLACEPCIKNTCKRYGIPKCLLMIDEMRIIEALRVYLPHHA